MSCICGRHRSKPLYLPAQVSSKIFSPGEEGGEGTKAFSQGLWRSTFPCPHYMYGSWLSQRRPVREWVCAWQIVPDLNRPNHLPLKALRKFVAAGRREGVRCDVGADKNNCVEICHWARIRMRGNVSGSAFFNAWCELWKIQGKPGTSTLRTRNNRNTFKNDCESIVFPLRLFIPS